MPLVQGTEHLNGLERLGNDDRLAQTSAFSAYLLDRLGQLQQLSIQCQASILLANKLSQVLHSTAYCLMQLGHYV